VKARARKPNSFDVTRLVRRGLSRCMESVMGRVALSLAIIVATVGASQAGDVRAVLELFTSQGCSSCPPADKLVGDLAGDPSVIAVSLPIDYWDYLGWKDTLAKPRHTARQRGYAAERGDREVYTPQMVVNGVKHALGSDRAAIEKAIAESKQVSGTLGVPVTATVNGDKLNVHVAAAEGNRGEAWLCTISKRVPVAIKRGENGGHTVTYNNVVRRWIRLGEWNGTARTFSLPLGEINSDGADAVAVLLQAGTMEKPGKMLGAGSLALR
jgi:hypothetical protein